jgi:hypothetical protein
LIWETAVQDKQECVLVYESSQDCIWKADKLQHLSGLFASFAKRTEFFKYKYLFCPPVLLWFVRRCHHFLLIL